MASKKDELLVYVLGLVKELLLNTGLTELDLLSIKTNISQIFYQNIYLEEILSELFGYLQREPELSPYSIDLSSKIDSYHLTLYSK